MERAVCAEIDRRMTLVALDLKRFQLKTGTSPGSLADLVPDYLHVVPIDPMTCHSLTYHLKPDSSFRQPIVSTDYNSFTSVILSASTSLDEVLKVVGHEPKRTQP